LPQNAAWLKGSIRQVPVVRPPLINIEQSAMVRKSIVDASPLHHGIYR
jgi:hypothetical protein